MDENKELTFKQQAFVDCYTGNGTEAAREAGYTGDDNTLCHMGKQNLRLPHILRAIRARQLERLDGPIMTREQRQKLWTDMALNAPHVKDRLQAARLLGMSECDFITKTEVTYPDQIQYTEEEKTALRELAVRKAKEILSEEV
jgi:phage terminase small subunit